MGTQSADTKPPIPDASGVWERPFGHGLAVVGSVVFGIAILVVLLWP